MSLLKILFFEPYPFGKESGSLKTQSYIFEFMDKTKYTPIVIAPFETGFTNRVRDQGIECIIIKPPKRIMRYGGECLRDTFAGRVITMLDMVRYNLKMMPVIWKKKIDLIFTGGTRAAISIGLAAKLSRTPHLLYIKGELQNRILDTVSFFLSDKILFQCNANKNDISPKLRRYFSKNLDILEPGIAPEGVIKAETKDKSELITELSINRQDINIAFMGQLYAQKGVHFLLEAFHLLVKNSPNVKIFIVGDHIIDEYKTYRIELDTIIEKYKLGDKVVFTGWRPDALEILSLMDILVHPSLSEGFPWVVIEAMALGKPVVATTVGGSREILRDGENGFLVEPGNPFEIANKLSILLNEKNLRLKFGKAARDTVFSNYLIQHNIERLQKIWDEMKGNKSN